MLLAEPPRTSYDLNFSVAGFPVRIHPFFWIVSILLAGSSAPREILMWVFVVFVSILIHELGHAIAIRRFGYQPRITLYGMGGLASYDQGFTPSYGSYSSRRNDAQSQILISAAGPAAGFAFASVIVALLYAFNRSTMFLGYQIGRGTMLSSIDAQVLIWQLLFVNVMWGFVNLFPVYPLDGGKIARELFLMFNPNEGLRHSLILSIVTAAALALYAFVQWERFFVTLLFGMLAYNSYQMLQGGGSGGFGRRPW